MLRRKTIKLILGFLSELMDLVRSLLTASSERQTVEVLKILLVTQLLLHVTSSGPVGGHFFEDRWQGNEIGVCYLD
jgi:hypothetical protein